MNCCPIFLATSTCSAIIIENNHHRLANKTCSSVLYSVCERSIPDSTIFVSAPSRSITTSTSNASTALPSVPGWTKNRRHEYYISYDDVTNSEAETYCRDKLNSSLTFFTMATAYFRMAEELSLTAGEYWVGGMIICVFQHAMEMGPIGV